MDEVLSNFHQNYVQNFKKYKFEIILIVIQIHFETRNLNLYSFTRLVVKTGVNLQSSL
jgi:hypothetical protein